MEFHAVTILHRDLRPSVDALTQEVPNPDLRRFGSSDARILPATDRPSTRKGIRSPKGQRRLIAVDQSRRVPR
jgi:hypothetical protein